MNANCINRLVCTVAVTTASLAVASANAQMALDEIVVVANRVESNLMETATAVTAFDSDTRQQFGIENAQDISARTPSLTIAPSRISIRGVGRPTVALGSDPGVGLYWDGVYNTENDIFSYSNFLDIDRIEILRGPQGTLYGRNSIGGAINFISKQPTEEWEGKIVAELGSYDSYILQGIASGPVTDKLSVLAALSQIERKEGFQQDVDSDREYDLAKSTYGTIAFSHDTTERWSNSLKLYVRDGSTTPENPYVLDAFSTDFISTVNDTETGTQLNFGGFFPGESFVNTLQGMTKDNPALADAKNVSIDRKPFVDNERDSAIFISDYDADTFRVKYTFGYSKFSYGSDYDADLIRAEDSGLDWGQLELAPGLPVSLLTGYTVTPADTTRPFSQSSTFTSHELQFISDFSGDLNFIGGLYYYDSEEDQALAFIEHNQELRETYAVLANFVGGGPVPVDLENGYLFRGEANIDTTSYAAYGQIKWDITADTVLTLGLRYTYDEKDASDNYFVQWVGDPNDPTVYRDIEDNWNKVTWRVGVDHFLSDDHFLYGFAATGYRSGGFNLMTPTGADQVGSVDPEDLLSLEIGYKGSFWNRRVNLATAIYFYDYEDLQVLRSDIIEGVPLTVYENAKEAEAWGVEAELVALIAEGLTFSLAASYNHSEYKDFSSVDSEACSLGPLREGNSQDSICTELQNLSGNNFPLTPEKSLSANLVYNWEMLALRWMATSSYLFTDEQYTSLFNNDDYDLLDSYDRWDARLTAGSVDLTWEVTAYVKNISDDRQVFFKGRPSTINNTTAYNLTAPRTYGLRLTYNF